jgi:hypothetical protein
MLGSSRVTPSLLGGFTSKSNKCFTDAWCNPKCSRLEVKCSHIKLSTQTKNPPQMTWISQRVFGGVQEAVERVRTWSRTSNPWERGWSAFYRNLEKLAVRAVRADRSDRSTIPVRPLWRLQTGLGHSLKKSLSDDTIGLGPRHVWRRAGQVWWSSNYNSHIVHWTYLVKDRTYPKNLSGIR